ncbi:MAG: D-sedoheptulose-7-phosphate isomerase [Acidimicrobiales bacterium]
MTESTDFLYPFIEGADTDAAALLDDLSLSAAGKWGVSLDLCRQSLAESRDLLAAAAGAMAESFAAGGRLYAFGNGGSATDADGIVALFADGRPGVRYLPARSLVADQAVITALSNDVGFDNVFSRQLMAHGRAGDVAVGFSTSGNSQNLLSAFAEAKRRGMVTVGFSGIDGGRMAVDPNLNYCLVARSQSVHRVQEAQAALVHRLWLMVHQRLEARAPAA